MLATVTQRSIILGLMIAFAAGCGAPPAFHAETVIHPDGSCDRAIKQHKTDFLPKSALEPQWKSLWKTITDAAGPPDEIQPANAPKPDTQTYFIARGTFATPSEIPAHFQLTIPEMPEVGSSELERVYERIDHGFVVEHRWTEKVTNIVTMPRFLLARDRLLNILLPFSTDAIEKVLGKDYDVSQLTAHIRTRGRHWLENTSLILYESAINHRILGKNQQLDPTLLSALLDEAESFGLDRREIEIVLSPSSDPIVNKERIYFQLAKLFSAHCRHRDGSEIKVAEAQELIIGIQDGSRYQVELANQNARFDTLLKENQALAKRVRQSAIEMLGLYWAAKFMRFNGQIPFDFSLTLPGTLIETTGIGTENGRTRWKFTGADVYPDGYTMKARSLVIDRESQVKALGRVVIDTSAQALEFIDLIGSDSRLQEAVRQLAKKGRREVLNDQPTLTYDERARVKKLRAFLFPP